MWLLLVKGGIEISEGKIIFDNGFFAICPECGKAFDGSGDMCPACEKNSQIIDQRTNRFAGRVICAPPTLMQDGVYNPHTGAFEPMSVHIQEIT